MKNRHLILLLPIWLFSCTNDFDGQIPNQEEQTNAVLKMKTNSINSNLSTIVRQLVTAYQLNNGSTPNTLSQKIILLEEIANENADFVHIKPVNFSVPTVWEAHENLTNYNTVYTNLNVSVKVKNYFNLLLEQNINLNIVESYIKDDVQLNASEKELLVFIVNCIEDHSENGDNDWKKKMIVAAATGYEVSTAATVFNVALLRIYN